MYSLTSPLELGCQVCEMLCFVLCAVFFFLEGCVCVVLFPIFLLPFFLMFRLCFLLKSELSLAGGGHRCCTGGCSFPLQYLVACTRGFYHVLRNLKWRLKGLVLYIQHKWYVSSFFFFFSSFISQCCFLVPGLLSAEVLEHNIEEQNLPAPSWGWKVLKFALSALCPVVAFLVQQKQPRSLSRWMPPLLGEEMWELDQIMRTEVF